LIVTQQPQRKTANTVEEAYNTTEKALSKGKDSFLDCVGKYTNGADVNTKFDGRLKRRKGWEDGFPIIGL